MNKDDQALFLRELHAFHDAGELLLVVGVCHAAEEEDIKLPVQDLVAEVGADVRVVECDLRGEIGDEVLDHARDEFFVLAGIVVLLDRAESSDLQDAAGGDADHLGGDGAVAGDVVGAVLLGEKEEAGHGLLHIVDRHEVNLVRSGTGDADRHLHLGVRREAGLEGAVALDAAEELQDAVERERLADHAVGTAPDDDGGTVDGVRDANVLADILFRVELAALVGVDPAGGGHGVFHDAAGESACDVSGTDVLETRDVEALDGFDRVQRAVHVGRISLPLGVLAEVDVRGAMEHHIVGSVFRDLFEREFGHVAGDDGDAGHDGVVGSGIAIKFALGAHGKLRALLGGLSRIATADGNDLEVGIFAKQRRDDGRPDQTRDTGKQDIQS